MGCASAKSGFEDKKKAVDAFLGEENSHAFQAQTGNDAAKKVCTSNFTTDTVGPEGKHFRLWKGLDASLEWTDVWAEKWEATDWKINWMVDGPGNLVIFQTHYTPKFKDTGKSAPTMEDLMLAGVSGKKVSSMKYFWSNPGAVSQMVASENIFQKMGHMFHHDSSAPFLELDPEATSGFEEKEVALRGLLGAWRQGQLDAAKAAMFCTDDVKVVAVGPAGPQYKVYNTIAELVEWFTFHSKEESQDWKIKWAVNGPDSAIICQVSYTAEVKETSVKCETVEDILVAKVTDNKVSHLQYYWGNVSETSKLHPNA